MGVEAVVDGLRGHGGIEQMCGWMRGWDVGRKADPNTSRGRARGKDGTDGVRSVSMP